MGNGSQGSGEIEVSSPYEQSIAIYRGINVIAQALARAPLRVYRDEEPLDHSPLQSLLNRPNQVMRQSQFVRTVATHQLLYGNAFVYVDEPNSFGVPRALLPLNPEHVEPFRRAGEAYNLLGWTYSPPGMGRTEKPKVIPVNRMLHFQYALSPHDPIMGISPIQVARLAYEADNAAAVYNKSILMKGGVPAGILRWQGDGLFDEDDAAFVRDQWQNTYGAADGNPESVAVLGGNYEYQSIGVPTRDMQWLESRKFNLAELARALNIPLMFLNEYESSGLSDAGMRIQWRMFYSSSISPMASEAEDVFTHTLVPTADRRNTVIAFDFDNVEALQEDVASKIANAKGYLELGYTLNQVNEKFELGMEEVPWGDTKLVPFGQVPIETLVDGSYSPENPETPETPENPASPASPAVPEEEEEGGEDLAGPLAALVPAQVRSVPARSIDVDLTPYDEGLYVHSVIAESERYSEAELAEAMQRNGLPLLGAKQHGKACVLASRQDSDFVDGTLRMTRAADGIVSVTGRLAADYVGLDGNWCLPPWRRALVEKRKKAAQPIEARMQSRYRRFFSEMRRGIDDILKKTERAVDLSNTTLSQAEVQAILAYTQETDLAVAMEKLIKESFSASFSYGLSQAVSMGIISEEAVNHLKARLPALSNQYYWSRVPRWTALRGQFLDNLRDLTAQGVAEGWTLNETMMGVHKLFNDNITVGHSRTVARTETGIGFSQGQVQSYRDAGVTEIEWLSAGDDHVRPSHQIDGQVRAIGVPFTNGLERPSEDGGPAGEIINCRCAVMPVKR